MDQERIEAQQNADHRHRQKARAKADEQRLRDAPRDLTPWWRKLLGLGTAALLVAVGLSGCVWRYEWRQLDNGPTFFCRSLVWDDNGNMIANMDAPAEKCPPR